MISMLAGVTIGAALAVDPGAGAGPESRMAARIKGSILSGDWSWLTEFSSEDRLEILHKLVTWCQVDPFPAKVPSTLDAFLASKLSTFSLDDHPVFAMKRYLSMLDKLFDKAPSFDVLVNSVQKVDEFCIDAGVPLLRSRRYTTRYPTWGKPPSILHPEMLSWDEKKRSILYHSGYDEPPHIMSYDDFEPF